MCRKPQAFLKRPWSISLVLVFCIFYSAGISIAQHCPGIAGLNRVDESSSVLGCLTDGNRLILADYYLGLSTWEIAETGLEKKGEWMRRQRSPWSFGYPVWIRKHSDDYLLAAGTNYPIVWAFDIRDFQHPVPIWNSSSLPEHLALTWGFDFRDSTLVLSGTETVLYDLSDIHSPRVTTTSIRGGQVALCAGDLVTNLHPVFGNGLRVYRLVPGGEPTLLDSWGDHHISYDSLIVSGEDLVLIAPSRYGSDRTGDIIVVDLEDPEHPLFFDLSEELSPWNYVYDLVFDGRIAYASVNAPVGENYFLEKIDFSDPEHPEVLRIKSGFGKLALTENRLIVTGGYTVNAWDLDLESREVLKVFGAPEKILFDGDLAVMANGNAGVSTWDASDPLHLNKLGELILGEEIWVDDLVIRDDYAYLAASDDGLVVVDYSQPTELRRVAEFPIYEAQDIVLDGDLALVASSSPSDYDFDSLEVFDISVPPHPVHLSSVPGFQKSWATCIAAEHGIAYLGSRGKILIVDLSDPTNPNELSVIKLYGDDVLIPDLAVSNSRLYVGNYVNGSIDVYDVSDPTLPELVTTVRNEGSAALSAEGNLLYYTGVDCVSVADFSEPTQPVVHSLEALRGSWALTPHNGKLFLAAPPSIEVISLDCSPPEASFEVEILGNSVQFVNTSTSWWDEICWDFGDGNSLEGSRDARHNYESAGDYEVILSISGENGDSSFAQSVSIPDAPMLPLLHEKGIRQ